MSVYMIKPLEWKKVDSRASDVFEQYEAHNGLFGCAVTKYKDKNGNPWWGYRWTIVEYYNDGMGECENLEDGKEFCEQIWINALEQVLIKEN